MINKKKIVGIFSVFAISIAIFFVAINIFSMQEKNAYANDTYTIKFYLVDGGKTTFVTSRTVNQNENIENLPIIEDRLGYKTNWYDENNTYCQIENGINNVEGDKSYFAKYDIYFNSINNFRPDGREENPYVIDTVERFYLFIDICNDVCFYEDTNFENEYIILNNDISLSDNLYMPIENFYGIFDGKGNKINNLTIDYSEEEDKAHFIYNNYGKIKNTVFFSLDFIAKNNASVIENNFGEIENCIISGNISSKEENAAGFATNNYNKIQNSISNGFIKSEKKNAAGLAGINYGSISCCFNAANIVSYGNIGGIAAKNTGGIIENCYNNGNISLYNNGNEEDHYCGGIAGVSEQNSMITNSFDCGNITSQYDNFFGSVVGCIYNNTILENCFFYSNIAITNNSSGNKKGWTAIFDEEGNEYNFFPIQNIECYNTLEISGGQHSVIFTDISLWIFAQDDIENGKVYFPQLYSFVYNEYDFYKDISLQNSEKDYQTCQVTLYDDYGQLISKYKVFSGNEKLPQAIPKDGFVSKGWSASIGSGNIISSDAIIVYDTTLYSVYEIEPMEYNFEASTVQYGYNAVGNFMVSHNAIDRIIVYQWYKRQEDNSFLPLEGQTGSTIILTECNESGLYKCNATLYSGKYTTIAYDTKKLQINRKEININIPMFSKIYGEQDTTLSLIYETHDATGKQIDFEICYIREEGEIAGSYNLISADCKNENFEINFIGEMENKFIIEKANYEYTFSFVDEDFVYDGNYHVLDYYYNLPEGLSVNVSMIGDGISAGDHILTAVFSGDFENYNNIKNITHTMKISKATYNMEEVVFHINAFVYDGKNHFPQLYGALPEGVSMNFDLEGAKNAGEYTINIYFSGDDKNYFEIPSTATNMVIIPKAIKPIFVLPGNMIENGEEKIISAYPSSKIEGDEINFEISCPQKLINAGTYQLSASIDNPNYILYDNTIVLEIMLPHIENDGEIESSISSQNGLFNQYQYRIEEIKNEYLIQNYVERIGEDKDIKVFSASLLLGNQSFQPLEEIEISIKLSRIYDNAKNLKIFVADNGNLQEAVYSYQEGIFSIKTNVMGDIIIVMDTQTKNGNQNEIKPGFGLRKIIVCVFAFIFVLIIINVAIFDRRKRRLKSAKKSYWDILKPLSEEKRKELYKKLSSGEMVDWELNRDIYYLKKDILESIKIFKDF